MGHDPTGSCPTVVSPGAAVPRRRGSGAMVPRRGSAPWFRFRGSALPKVGTAAPEAPHGAPPPACRCARSDIWEGAEPRKRVAGTEPRAGAARNHAPHRRSTRRRGSAFPNVGPVAPEAPHGAPPPACRHARSDIWEGAGRRKRVAGTEPRVCAERNHAPAGRGERVELENASVGGGKWPLVVGSDRA